MFADTRMDAMMYRHLLICILIVDVQDDVFEDDETRYQIG